MEKQARDVFRTKIGRIKESNLDPAWLATELWSAGIVGDDDVEKASNEREPAARRRGDLILSLMGNGAPDVFQTFVKVLSGKSHLEWLGKELQDSYSERRGTKRKLPSFSSQTIGTELNQFQMRTAKCQLFPELSVLQMPFTVTVDVDTLKVLSVKETVKDIFGFAPDDFVGTTLTDYFHPSDYNKLIPSVSILERTGYGISPICRFMTGSGEWVCVQMEGIVRYSEDSGEPQFLDISVKVVRIPTNDLMPQKCVQEAYELAPSGMNKVYIPESVIDVVLHSRELPVSGNPTNVVSQKTEAKELDLENQECLSKKYPSSSILSKESPSVFDTELDSKLKCVSSPSCKEALSPLWSVPTVCNSFSTPEFKATSADTFLSTSSPDHVFIFAEPSYTFLPHHTTIPNCFQFGNQQQKQKQQQQQRQQQGHHHLQQQSPVEAAILDVDILSLLQELAGQTQQEPQPQEQKHQMHHNQRQQQQRQWFLQQQQLQQQIHHQQLVLQRLIIKQQQHLQQFLQHLSCQQS